MTSRKKLYHVSCITNIDSIATRGLVPYEYTSYNENAGPIYLAKLRPSDHIHQMKRVTGNRDTLILDDYMQMSAPDCDSAFVLYKIDATKLDPTRLAVSPHGDAREMIYKAVIPPSIIEMIATYDSKEIEKQYEQNEHSKRRRFDES